MQRTTIIGLCLCACTQSAAPPAAPIDCRLPETSHPIDRIVQPLLEERCLPIVEERPDRLCRRLFSDLVGRRPTPAERAELCDGRDIADIVDDLHEHPRHRLVAQRYWRDHLFMYEDRYRTRITIDFFRFIDQLEEGEIDFAEFVVLAASHPKLIGFSSFGIVRLFSGFLGRFPTDYERGELSKLYRVWMLFYDGTHFRPIVDAERCADGQCSTELFGGARIELDLPDIVLYDDLRPEHWDVLRTPGRWVARQPSLWEGTAESLLEHYLGWSDGGITPRTTASILPHVRQVLAEHLERTGDVHAVEKLILTSLLYRQSVTARPQVDAPIYAYGPLKRITVEVWLDSMTSAVGLDIGACDPKFRDAQALRDAPTADLWEQQQSTFPWSDETDGPILLAQDFMDRFGGCGLNGKPIGPNFGFNHESVVEAICNYADVPGSLEEVAGVLVPRFLSRDATAEDVEDLSADFDCHDCGGRARAAYVCQALAGSVEMQFQ